MKNVGPGLTLLTLGSLSFLTGRSIPIAVHIAPLTQQNTSEDGPKIREVRQRSLETSATVLFAWLDEFEHTSIIAVLRNLSTTRLYFACPWDHPQVVRFET